DADDLRYQLSIADLMAISQHRGRHLRIEDGARHSTSLDGEDFEILAPRMHDLQDPIVSQEIEQRIEGRKGLMVDDGRDIIGRHLNDFEAWREAVFAHEFRVE